MDPLWNPIPLELRDGAKDVYLQASRRQVTGDFGGDAGAFRIVMCEVERRWLLHDEGRMNIEILLMFDRWMNGIPLVGGHS